MSTSHPLSAPESGRTGEVYVCDSCRWWTPTKAQAQAHQIVRGHQTRAVLPPENAESPGVHAFGCSINRGGVCDCRTSANESATTANVQAQRAQVAPHADGPGGVA